MSIEEAFDELPDSPFQYWGPNRKKCPCCNSDFMASHANSKYCSQCKTCLRCKVGIPKSSLNCSDYENTMIRRYTGYKREWLASCVHYCKKCEEIWKIRTIREYKIDSKIVRGLSELKKDDNRQYSFIDIDGNLRETGS